MAITTRALKSFMDGREAEYVKKWRVMYSSLSGERQKMLPIFQDIRDYAAPRTARFMGEEVGSGNREDRKILNGSPRTAIRVMGAGMQSGVTSPMRPWFRITMADPDLVKRQAVKNWLYDVENVLREIMSRSNIYDRFKSLYVSQGTYGTGGLFIDEDVDDIIRAHEFPIGSYIPTTNASGRPNGCARDVHLTAPQMVEKFGERCPSNIREAYDRGDYATRHHIIHIVEKNRFEKEDSAFFWHKKWASIYLYPAKNDEEAILDYQGYDNCPFFGPRWDVLGEETFGVGCGELAIGDCKMMQVMERRSLQSLDQFTAPTMVADASMRNQNTTNMSGQVTFVNGLVTGNQGFRPAYQINNPYLDMIDSKIMRVEHRVDEVFYKNLFLLVSEIADQPNITATQINTMREEKLMQLGPVLERLNDELLDPVIELIFNVANARGLLPPPPEEINGQPLKVEYISVLAQAQKAMGIGNIERFIGFVGGLAQFSPAATHKLNVEEIIDHYADGVAIPPRIIRTNEEVQQIMAQQQQQQQQQAMMDQAPALAKAARDVSEIGGGSNDLLSQLTGA